MILMTIEFYGSDNLLVEVTSGFYMVDYPLA